MPNPKSGTFALNGTSPFVPARLAARSEAARTARWIGNALRTQATRFLAWRARRLTMRLLASLDSATLRDLGLTDIESEVYGDPRDRMRGYDRNWWKQH
jgi:uncharacterized protein YjiS (DUF1127 family)